FQELEAVAELVEQQRNQTGSGRRARAAWSGLVEKHVLLADQEGAKRVLISSLVFRPLRGRDREILGGGAPAAEDNYNIRVIDDGEDLGGIVPGQEDVGPVVPYSVIFENRVRSDRMGVLDAVQGQTGRHRSRCSPRGRVPALGRAAS